MVDLLTGQAPMTDVLCELNAHLGYTLRSVSNQVSQAFAQKLATAGVAVPEWVFLRLLHDTAGVPPSRLADQMDLTRGAITKLADRLIARALILREASSEDGRAQTLRLTEKGRRLVPRLSALADQNEAECFSCLSSQDRSDLARILRCISDHAGIVAPPVD